MAGQQTPDARDEQDRTADNDEVWECTGTLLVRRDSDSVRGSGGVRRAGDWYDREMFDSEALVSYIHTTYKSTGPDTGLRPFSLLPWLA